MAEQRIPPVLPGTDVRRFTVEFYGRNEKDQTVALGAITLVIPAEQAHNVVGIAFRRGSAKHRIACETRVFAG